MGILAGVGWNGFLLRIDAVIGIDPDEELEEEVANVEDVR